MLLMIYTVLEHSMPDIIYQDADIVAVNKPAGLLSVPGRGADKQDCLATRVQRKFPTARIVHRLDQPTSGLMLMALTEEMQKQLGTLFERRQIAKKYIAVVNGIPTPAAGVIDKPLICDWPNRPKQKVDFTQGKSAITRFQVIKVDEKNCRARLELFPETGRSHQLRVHLLSIGHPILGDSLYTDMNQEERLCLHATELSFRHPETNEKISLHCPVPF